MDMEPLTLLLVDGEEQWPEITHQRLRRLGHNVQTAPGGPEALAVLQRQNVHVVILDVKTPGMDFFKVLKEIKAQFPLVEVIALTGLDTIESAVEGLLAGAVDYLMKPVNLQQLAEKVLAAFTMRRRIEERMRMARRQCTSNHPSFRVANTCE
jgi:DNA-binding NtrC family response regulator